MILLWRVATKCNFACGFCAYDRRLDIPRHEIDPSEVSRVVELFRKFAAQKSERLHLSWLGGEPFLWPPLLALSRMISAHGDVAISATTNGSRLSVPEVRQQILSYFSELTISIDGPPQVHDQLRGVSGAFAKTEGAVRKLVAERTALGAFLKIRVNTVLMRRTLRK